jgi:hypothetical protein
MAHQPEKHPQSQPSSRSLPSLVTSSDSEDAPFVLAIFFHLYGRRIMGKYQVLVEENERKP